MVVGALKFTKCLPPATLAHLLFAAIHDRMGSYVGDGLTELQKPIQTILHWKGQLLEEKHRYLTSWGQEVWLHSNRYRKWNYAVIRNHDLCSNGPSVRLQSLVPASLHASVPHFFCTCSLAFLVFPDTHRTATLQLLSFLTSVFRQLQQLTRVFIPVPVRDIQIGPFWASSPSQSDMRE